MSRHSLRAAMRRVSLLIAAMACWVGPAQAAVYTGVWDPAFGAPFTNLGWRGSAQFEVPSGCEPAGTADISNAADCGGLAVVTQATVELYDIRAAGTPTLATLSLDETTLLIGTLRYLNGALTELTTSPSAQVGTSVDLSEFLVQPGTLFSLDFTLAGPRLGWVACRDLAKTSCDRGFNDGVNFPPTFVITRVPEPATLALVALALAALVWARRSAPQRSRVSGAV